MSAQTLELQQKISEWRRRAVEGTLTKEEMIEAIKHLRAGRLAASQSAASTKRKKATEVIVNAEDLLKEMDEL